MTGRLPFDPDRIKRSKRAGPGDEQSSGPVVRSGTDAPWTITQLAARIDGAIKSGVPGRIRVVGEVSSVSNRTHWYFSLKDEGAVISAVVFASAARKLAAPPTQGERVIASGRLDFYAPSGRVSLIVDSLEPVGQGSLERELKARVDDLRARGWLDQDRKRPLPVLPRRIAVITSKDGAAVQDVIDTARRRLPFVGLLIVDVRVQGERAAPEVAHAIRAVSDRHKALGIDAILVTRGGGSLEDLWAFNEMPVAEAIHESRVPVVAAIGHETDTTIAELVADLRAATPTQAVMQLVPDRDAIEQQLAATRNELRAGLVQRLRANRAEVDRLAQTRELRDPRAVLARHSDRTRHGERALRAAGRARVMFAERRLGQLAARLERHRPAAVHARRDERLRSLTGRLQRAAGERIARGSEAVDALHRELHAVGPMQVLARGYSVTTGPNGGVIRSATDAKAGDELTTRLVESSLVSRVVGGSESGVPTRSKPDSQQSLPVRRSKKSRTKPKQADPDQMGLF